MSFGRLTLAFATRSHHWVPCMPTLNDLLDRFRFAFAKNTSGHLNRGSLTARPTEHGLQRRTIKTFGEDRHADQHVGMTFDEVGQLTIAIRFRGHHIAANPRFVQPRLQFVTLRLFVKEHQRLPPSLWFIDQQVSQ